ncbi:putative mitotic centromere-associated kinesin [Diplonema papillatum]|nr:putative mitotic centromere-associated kinesin [Diplonema papillatum]
MSPPARNIRYRVQKKKEKPDSVRIQVVVRKRPIHEAERAYSDIIQCSAAEVRVSAGKKRLDLSEYIETHAFKFDEAFNENAETTTVYEHTAKHLLDTFLSGRNASCFAYGQTGSGKTHTMIGDSAHDGMYVLAARDIFARMGTERFADLEISASLFEIYCEKLYDLMNNKSQVHAREDASGHVKICGLTEHAVKNAAQMLRLVSTSAQHRSNGSTAANARSSRSHAVLRINLRRKSGARVSHLSFVDLAGSERGADTTDRDKKTQREGSEINKSLLALKECIRGIDMGHTHIKFRGSKLTEVLKASFVGESKTCMIATISPSHTDCEHSMNTLRYAHRVKGLPPVKTTRSAPKKPPPEPARQIPTKRQGHTGSKRKKQVAVVKFVDRALDYQTPTSESSGGPRGGSEKTREVVAAQQAITSAQSRVRGVEVDDEKFDFRVHEHFWGDDRSRDVVVSAADEYVGNSSCSSCDTTGQGARSMKTGRTSKCANVGSDRPTPGTDPANPLIVPNSRNMPYPMRISAPYSPPRFITAIPSPNTTGNAGANFSPPRSAPPKSADDTFHKLTGAKSTGCRTSFLPAPGEAVLARPHTSSFPVHRCFKQRLQPKDPALFSRSVIQVAPPCLQCGDKGHHTLGCRKPRSYRSRSAPSPPKATAPACFRPIPPYSSWSRNPAPQKNRAATTSFQVLRDKTNKGTTPTPHSKQALPSKLLPVQRQATDAACGMV